jgi:hypothetical protein
MLAVARALLVGSLIVGAVLGVSLSRAEAHFAESLTGFGEELAKWTMAKPTSTVAHFSVNGLEMHRMTASTSLSIKDTLDRLQRVCRERGGIETSAALLEARKPYRTSRLSGTLEGTYRHDGDHDGVLACIDTGAPLGITELARRLQEFAATGDLSTIGKLRFVLAQRQGSVTSVLVIWTENNANLLKMFPKVGDAPGCDVPDVPRPEEAERLLAASDLDAPYRITVYRSIGRSPDSLRDWYEARLTERGWLVAKQTSGNTVAAHRGGRTVVIHVGLAASGQTLTTMAELS